MDRREALRRMAAGGMTIVGTTMIVSSRAFGLSDPTPPAQPTIGATVAASDDVINVTVGTSPPTCVGTASSPTTASVPITQYAVIGTPSRASATPSSGTLAPGGTHAFSVARTANGNASITIEFRARYRCAQGASTTEVCRSWTLTFARSGNSWGSVGSPFTPTVIGPGAVCPV